MQREARAAYQTPLNTAQPPGHPNVTGGLHVILDFDQIGYL